MKQHSNRFLTFVAEAKKNIQEISPLALKTKMDQNQPLTLIDVREDNEWTLGGHIPHAIHLSKGIIERDIEKIIPDPEAAIVVYCSGGFRCALVAASLKQMGYSSVCSLESGLQGWVDAGFSIEH